jgi:hypothetical protein
MCIYIHRYIHTYEGFSKYGDWELMRTFSLYIYVSTKTVDLIVNRRTYITIKTTHDCDEMCVARLRTFQWVSFGLTSNLYIYMYIYIYQYYMDFVGNHVYHVFVAVWNHVLVGSRGFCRKLFYFITCVYMYVYTYMNMCIYIYIHEHLCNICIYIYIYLNIYIYKYIYTCIRM